MLTRILPFAFAALLLPVAAGAQSPADLSGTGIVEMKGTLVANEQAADAVGWGGISFGFTGDDANTVRWFSVAHAELFGSDSFDAKTAVFSAHKVPALIMAGPPAQAKKLLALPNGTRVHIEGALDFGSRMFLLDVVEQLPAGP